MKRRAVQVREVSTRASDDPKSRPEESGASDAYKRRRAERATTTSDDYKRGTEESERWL